jgi:hypothetical protein
MPSANNETLDQITDYYISLNHQDVINASNKLDFADYYQHCQFCEAISLLE